MLIRRIAAFLFLLTAFSIVELVKGNGLQLLDALTYAVIFMLSIELVNSLFADSRKEKSK
ncbi:hypothetical protein F9U64_10395 [Gracilibacillus oryzae]|uniref:Uncharacterized protein n=1 Tax=Gracilibacillus oryzae TaxID=1672701 RepID=A0A7C8GT91_9BACI|nr:hypothetical protein [Gracilibacillus oryzae]KAB8136236.1 hypothetical protein F9U64_10395 [Gracilibacillus oryzae]